MPRHYSRPIAGVTTPPAARILTPGMPAAILAASVSLDRLSLRMAPP
jgi:hypothetical protein